MPLKKVEPHTVQRHGETRWRVYIPADLNAGKVGAARYFKLKADASAYARDLETQRGGNTSDFAILSQATQACVIRALHLVDGDGEKLLQAVDLFRRTPVQVSSGKTLAAVVEECVEQKRASGKSPRYVQALGANLRRFSGTIAEMPVEKVTHTEIERWLDGAKLRMRTRRGYLIDVRTLFVFAIKRGYLTTNPAESIETPEVEAAPRGILTVRECAALLDTTLQEDPGLIPWLALSLFAGLRPSEAAVAEWSWVKPDFVEVPAAASKTGRRRLVPIEPVLRQWLDLGGDLRARNIKKRRQYLRAAAGISWPQDCLRHSFVSYAIPIHGTAKVARAAGHTEWIQAEHYDAIVEEKQAHLFWSLTPENLTAPETVHVDFATASTAHATLG
jgi:integrase